MAAAPSRIVKLHPICPLLVLSGQREGNDGFIVERLAVGAARGRTAEARTGCEHCNILFSVSAAIADRQSHRRVFELLFPQDVAVARIEGAEEAIAGGADEHEAAGGYD